MVADLERAKFHLVKPPVHPTMSVQMKLSNPKSPWADPRVRQALAHAINGPEIVKGLLYGLPERYARLAPDELGYDPSLQIPGYDPALAKKLLAEAGYPSGFSTPLYYWAGTYYGLNETTSAVTLYWKEIGIQAQVQGMEGAQLLSLIRRQAQDPNGQYIAVAGLPIANLADPVESFDLYFYGGPDKNRPVLWRNDALDAIILKADAAFDPAERGTSIKEGMKIINDNLVTIPIWNYVDIYAMKPAYDYVPSHHGLAVVLLKHVSMTRQQSAR
jgi:peptide/nickel transport system substrate-binding protein